MNKINLEKWLRSLYRNIFLDRTAILKKALVDCKNVLDLGCGSDSPLQYCPISYAVGVDAYLSCLQESKKKRIHNEYIQGDIGKINFKLNSFDAVIALEVLEHLSKKDGYKLIRRAEGWARKKVIISTPNGYLFQDSHDGNPFQEHKSSWNPDDLKTLGYKVVGFHGWKKLRGYRSDVKYKPVFFWERISDLT